MLGRRAFFVQRRAVAGGPVDRQLPRLGGGLDRLAFRLDHLPEELAAEVDLGGAPQVRGGLVEVGGREVQPAGQLAQAQAEGVFGPVQPGVEGVNAADAGSGVAPAG